jgi:hypothetical protein
MLGFLNQNSYHEKLNITNIMKLKRLDFRDVYGVRAPDLILTRENLMERVMLLITAYFCMGTELRFLKQLMVEGFEDSIDSEFWHGKALELSIKFLPGDAPLVKHIVSSYQKHHSPSFEQIPEDEEVESSIKVIRPNYGISYDKVAPWIRDIPKPSVKLAPLDLPLNNYYEKSKSKGQENKSLINISECLKDSKSNNKKDETPEDSKSKIVQSEIEISKIDKISETEKPIEKIKTEKAKEGIKIVTDNKISQSKFLASIENTNSTSSKDMKDFNKNFAMFKQNLNVKQSKTIDQCEIKKSANTSSSIRSVSPSANTLNKRAGTILRTRTEETTINSIQSNSGANSQILSFSRNRLNKSNSNERSKSKKKGSSKERNSQRPKTSKGHKKDKLNPTIKNKLFKNFWKNKKDELHQNLTKSRIQGLIDSHSSGNTRAFPTGFWDRPTSVLDDHKTKLSKIKNQKERSKSKIKGNKSTRGGTPAPGLHRQKQPNTTWGINSSASQFIERSSSNEWIREIDRFNHNTSSKTRKGSAK